MRTFIQIGLAALILLVATASSAQIVVAPVGAASLQKAKPTTQKIRILNFEIKKGQKPSMKELEKQITTLEDRIEFLRASDDFAAREGKTTKKAPTLKPSKPVDKMTRIERFARIRQLNNWLAERALLNTENQNQNQLDLAR